MISQAPASPWTSFLIAIGVGPPIAAIPICAVATNFEHPAASWIATYTLNLMFVLWIVYFATLLAATFYAAPLLWLALRFNQATPAHVLGAAILPAVIIFAVSLQSIGLLQWLTLGVCVAVGGVFVWLAYPRVAAI